MNRFLIKKNVFLLLFTIYFTITAILFWTKLSIGHNWFSQWFFDKFFVFQFISIVIVGLVIESKYFHYLSYVRIGSRREILKIELLRYYRRGFLCLNIMFIFIILGALLLQVFRESSCILQLIEWYIRYLLGIILFINIMSCLKWSNNLILSRYCNLLTFIWMTIELILLKPYVKKFFSLDINLLFSWVFHSGSMGYFFILILIVLTTLLNIKFTDKRDFI